MFTRRLRFVEEAGRVSRCKQLYSVTIPRSSFISNFDYEIFEIEPVCVTLFTGKDEVGDETILEGFNRS